MARRRTPPISIHAQLVAVRRAASNAALKVSDELRGSARGKAELNRDALAQAAATLQAVRDSAEALAMMPPAQRERLAAALAAGGYRAVLSEDVVALPGGLHV